MTTDTVVARYAEQILAMPERTMRDRIALSDAWRECARLGIETAVRHEVVARLDAQEWPMLRDRALALARRTGLQQAIRIDAEGRAHWSVQVARPDGSTVEVSGADLVAACHQEDTTLRAAYRSLAARALLLTVAGSPAWCDLEQAVRS